MDRAAYLENSQSAYGWALLTALRPKPLIIFLHDLSMSKRPAD